MPTSSSSHFFFSSCAKASIPGSARRNPVTRATRGRAVQWHSKRLKRGTTCHFGHFRWFRSKWSFETTRSTCSLLLIPSIYLFVSFISFVHFILSLRNGSQTSHVRIANKTTVLRQTGSDWLSRLRRRRTTYFRPLLPHLLVTISTLS